MDPKDYLQQYHESFIKVKALNIHIRKLRDEAELLRTKDGHRIALDKAAANIVDAVDQLAAETARMKDLQRELRGVIDTVTDAEQRALLTLIYIEGLRLSTAARRMAYSYRQTKRIHKAALSAVAEILSSPK